MQSAESLAYKGNTFPCVADILLYEENSFAPLGIDPKFALGKSTLDSGTGLGR